MGSLSAMRLFVLFHQDIHWEYYPEYLRDSLIFVNLSEHNVGKYSLPGVHAFDQASLPGFVSLGKWYAESEFLYNLSRNLSLFPNVEYVGFVHYDYDLSTLSQSDFETALSHCDVVSFETSDFEDDYRQNIMMDARFPNMLQGGGKNCYQQIVEDYNQHYHSKHTVAGLVGAEICLCSAFVMKTAVLQQMMAFIAPLIERGQLNAFDKGHRYRAQGGFLERYFGVWMVLQGVSMKNLEMPHRFQKSTPARAPLCSRIKYKIFKTLRVL